MIRDGFLKFGNSQAMTGAGNFASLLGVSTFYPHPSPVIGTQAYDLLVAMDKGQGSPLVARIDVETTFASTDAAMTIAAAVAVSDANDGTGAFVIARGLPTLVGAWPAGSHQEIVIPKLPPTLSTTGRRYILVGFEIVTTIVFGNALFTGGVFTSWIGLQTIAENKVHASGFSVS